VLGMPVRVDRHGTGGSGAQTMAACAMRFRSWCAERFATSNRRFATRWRMGSIPKGNSPALAKTLTLYN